MFKKLLYVLFFILMGFVFTSTAHAQNVSAATPCVGQAAPSSWKIVVLMLENHTWSQIIGNSSAPYINSLSNKCGGSLVWNDANHKVDGSTDGNYNSKPSYAVLTSGVSPSVSGITSDTYSTKTSVVSIYDQMLKNNITFKNYYGSSTAGGCGVTWDGAYHDPIRYYSSLSSATCNAHDVPVDQFLTDLNSGNLPQFSFITPNIVNTMHNSDIAGGDNYTKSLIDPVLNSAEYKTGHIAVFILFDEESPIPNVLIAPSVKAGSRYQAVSGQNPVSHFAGLRTWEEMLNLSLIGDTPRAPSLLAFFGGTGVGNPQPTGTGSVKVGDINGDGKVDIVDVGIIIDNYGKSPIPNPKADLNHDGVIDIVDVGIIIDNYGK